jgi:hypothetical protein
MTHSFTSSGCEKGKTMREVCLYVFFYRFFLPFTPSERFFCALKKGGDSDGNFEIWE